MIHKSQQQDTDRAGDRLLRATLEPLGWVLTGIEEDYGIDHDVQVFVDGSPEGLWFKIQLKSSISSSYSADGSFVSVELTLTHAKHYALELRDPVFLIHADIQAKKIFWSTPQLDKELIEKLEEGNNSATVTVRIPTSNTIPGTADKLLQTVEKLYIALGNRTLVNSSASSFADSLKYQPGEGKLREECSANTCEASTITLGRPIRLPLARTRYFALRSNFGNTSTSTLAISSGAFCAIASFKLNRNWLRDSSG